MGIMDSLLNKATIATEKAVDNALAKTEEEAADVDVDFFMPLETPESAHVTCDVLNVRPTPSTKEARVGQLKRGSEITVFAVCDDWLEIEFEGQHRYVFGMYTDYDALEMTVTASSLNIRKGPGTDYDKIGSLENGTVVRVLAEKDGWVKILNGKHLGFVSKEYLK